MLRDLAVRIEKAHFARFRLAVVAGAADVTESVAERDAIVVAPHPDDETLGCGVAILRKRDAGRRVRVVLVTDGRGSHRSKAYPPERLVAVREEEMKRACGKLGVPEDDVVFLRVRDGETAAHEREIGEAIAREALAMPGAEVYSPCVIDGHSDHRAIARSVRALVASGRIRSPVWEYPVWFWRSGAWLDSAIGEEARAPKRGRLSALRVLSKTSWAKRNLRAAVVWADGYLDRKRSALLEHRTQTTKMTTDEPWLVLPEDFVAGFFQEHEVFFEVSRVAKERDAGGSHGRA